MEQELLMLIAVSIVILFSIKTLTNLVIPIKNNVLIIMLISTLNFKLFH